MARTVSIGNQDFEKMIQRNCFYVDKTGFIKEWWENEDEVTLITRPRRFGKTLNMSMLRYYFDCTQKDNKELFKGLK
mgnify:CR=1 FL=1